jgi:hypothetical protein
MDQADIEMPNGGGRATPSTPTPLRSAGAGRGAAQGVQSMGDVGTAFAARRATTVQAQVDAIPSFAELAGVEFAPPASMVKIHITPGGWRRLWCRRDSRRTPGDGTRRAGLRRHT